MGFSIFFLLQNVLFDGKLDRNADRNVDRNADRNVDRNADRNVDRNADRNAECDQKCPLITLCKTNLSKFYIPSFSSLFLSFYLPFIKTQHLQDQHGGSLMILQTFILHPQHKPFVFFALIFTCMSFYRVRKTKVERVYQSLPFTKFYNKLGT